MKLLSNQKFLAIYSGILTIAFAVTVLAGFTKSPSTLHLKELDVQRINVIEPNGTLRMVISDKHDFPGLIIKGKEYPHPDRQTAGMLFFNNEGTENGGLIFGGQLDRNGQPVSYGHLSFDKYMQDQTLVLEAHQEKGKYYKYLSINDQPDYPMTEMLPLIAKMHDPRTAQNEAAIKQFFAHHGRSTRRLILGEVPQLGLILDMKDKQGHDRIIMRVLPDGTPVLQFLDASGKVVEQLPQTIEK